MPANKPRRLLFECLESRKVLSLLHGTESFAIDELASGDDELHAADAKGGPAALAIDLPTVVLHEIGHALGLDHSDSPLCGTTAVAQPIMCPYYLGPSFSLKAEDTAKIAALYPDIAGSTTDIVTDSFDDRWDNPSLTYSYMPDGAGIDQGGRRGSNLISTLGSKIGNNWQAIFAEALTRWANATQLVEGHRVLQFTLVPDSGAAFNTSGGSQGDIRFGGHKFDSPGGFLGHTYFPPPNGATAAGDSHYASEENWKNLSGVPLSAPLAAGGSSGSGTGGASSPITSGPLRARDARLLLDESAVQTIFAGLQSNGSLSESSSLPTQPAPTVRQPVLSAWPRLNSLAAADPAAAAGDDSHDDGETDCLLLAAADDATAVQ